LKPPAASLPIGVRRGPFALVVMTLALAAAPPARAQSRFNIPAQEASSALVQLCLQADCELAFVPRPGQTARTRAVRGQMGWREALTRMLEGTGLRYRFVGARGVRVWAVASGSTTSPPPAEETEDTEVEAVAVIGRPSSQIAESLRRKRVADFISDGVFAERIGDLPAANLAEALQRVPGVAIEREVGEGQFVSVRGLGPLFQSVTLNGAPVAFNENIRNSTQSGRQFRFRALSADLLAGAVLAKSPTADLIDGGIGSNIDIRTVRGLDGRRRICRHDWTVMSKNARAWSRPTWRCRAAGDGTMAGWAWSAACRPRPARCGTTVFKSSAMARHSDRRPLHRPDAQRPADHGRARGTPARATAFVGVEWRPSPRYDDRTERPGLAVRQRHSRGPASSTRSATGPPPPRWIPPVWWSPTA
jgi:hypothetical protein